MRFSRENNVIRAWLARLGNPAVSAFRRGAWPSASNGKTGSLEGAVSSVLRSTENLDSVNRDLETRFLETERSLSQLNVLAERLLKESEGLLDFVTGRTGGAETLKEGFEVLGAPLDFVESSRTRTGRLMETLRCHERQMDAMRRHEKALGSAVAPLKYIQTMFRIESARLPADMQGIFLGLTKEIEELHRRVGEIFGEQFRRLSQARDAIDALITRTETQSRSRMEAATGKRSQVRRTLEELQSEVTQGEKADLALVKTTRGIASQVSRIIVAMQFQDIVRQKIEHVREGFSDIAAHQAGAKSLGGSNFRRNALYHRDAARVQKGQLQGVLSDISGAGAQYSDALGSIREMAAGLDVECGRLAECRSVSTGDDGMVPALLAALADMRELVAGISESLAETHRTLEPLGGLAANLTGVMRELSSHIKLIALNAQIQASQVGTGTGLEILSENTTRISDEIYRLNEAAAAELDTLIEGLNAAIEESSAMQRDATGVRTVLSERCGDMESRLFAHRDAVQNSFRAVRASAEALSQETAKALAVPGFSALVEERIDSLVQGLDAVSDAAGGIPDTEISGADSREALRHLNRNYTMESERVIHAASVAGGDVPATPGTTADVELFGDPAMTAETREPSPSTGAKKCAASSPDVELF